MWRTYQCKFIILTLIITTLLAAGVQEYIRNGTRRWFSDDLPTPKVVRQWTDIELDQYLHALSRWDGFSPAQFQSFADHQIRGLGLNKTEHFRYLEVGVGVGAFARYILNAYPNATGMGIDLEDAAISVAKEVLPPNRIHLLVADMVRIPTLASSFDYVFVPGSLCYLHSLNDVLSALAEFSRVLRPGGGLCASMLPSSISNMGSCNIRVPKSIWTIEGKRDFGLEVVALEEMDDWNLPHGLGRYSTCLRKSGLLVRSEH